MGKNRAIIIIITLLAVAIVVFAVLNSKQDTGSSVSKAIDFTLTDQYGTEHTLSDYEGKVVLWREDITI